MKRLSTGLLCGALCLLSPAHAYSAYGDDNPFVEAMLRMMEVFGLINRDSLPLGIPYLPGGATGLAGMGGMGGVPGMTGIPGLGYPGMGMMPGMSPLSPWGGMGSSGWQGMSPMTGLGGWPAGVQPWSAMNQYPWAGSTGQAAVADLNGVWELTNGSVVIIKGRNARLYVERDRHQDFTIGYDANHFWWSPRGSDTTTRYRYQMRDGRMVLRSSDGKVLLMRRRS